MSYSESDRGMKGADPIDRLRHAQRRLFHFITYHRSPNGKSGCSCLLSCPVVVEYFPYFSIMKEHVMLKKPTIGSSRRVRQHLGGWLIVLHVLAGAGCAAGYARLDHLDWEQSRLIDLTHSFGADTIVWPTEQDFRLVLQQAGDTSGGYDYASNC